MATVNGPEVKRQQEAWPLERWILDELKKCDEEIEVQKRDLDRVIESIDARECWLATYRRRKEMLHWLLEHRHVWPELPEETPIFDLAFEAQFRVPKESDR